MSLPPRILHLIDSWNLGGAQSVLLNLLEEMGDGEFSIRAYSLHGPGTLEEKAGSLCEHAGHLAASRLDPRMVPRLLSLARQWQPDIIHTHLVTSCFLAEMLRPVLPRKTVLVEHLHSLYRPAQRADRYQNYLETMIYRRCGAVLACSPNAARSLKAARRRTPRLRPVFNGIPDREITGCIAEDRARLRDEMGVKEGTPVFLSACRLVPAKGIAYGLEVFAPLCHDRPDARYWIAGTGPEEVALRRKAKDLRLQDNVKFLGFRNDVPALLSAADFLLMPSVYEGMGLAAVEAMAKETVPIVTPFAGHDALVKDGENAVVIPFGDANEAAARVARLLDGSALPQRLCRAGLQEARTRFPASRMAAKVRSLYGELLRKKA